MTETELARLHAIIEGRVQGVGFRMFVVDNAALLGVTGWVRNRYVGDVEVVAEGDRQTLGKLLNYLHVGPRAARVTNVEADWQSASGEFSRFTVRY
jgi:acylphosphatase